MGKVLYNGVVDNCHKNAVKQYVRKNIYAEREFVEKKIVTVSLGLQRLQNFGHFYKN